MSEAFLFIEDWRYLPQPILSRLFSLEGVLLSEANTESLCSLQADFKALAEIVGYSTINTNDLNALEQSVAPHEVRAVQSLSWLAESSHTTEELLAASVALNGILREIEAFLADKSLLCFHCTKEPAPGFFRQNGLRLLDCKRHQQEFMERYSYCFNEDELTYIAAAWEHYFQRQRQAAYRESQLWFCLTQGPLFDEGATGSFFKYMGGEAVFMPIQAHDSISAKLSQLGKAVVVVFGVPAVEIARPRGLAPLAFHILQRFHRSLNSAVSPQNLDGCVVTSVPPSSILAVIPRGELSCVLPLYTGAPREVGAQ